MIAQILTFEFYFDFISNSYAYYDV